jgi:hypothetical protein
MAPRPPPLTSSNLEFSSLANSVNLILVISKHTKNAGTVGYFDVCYCDTVTSIPTEAVTNYHLLYRPTCILLTRISVI